MLTWFKNIFGITPKREETVVLQPEQRVEEPAPKAQKTVTKPKKKAQKSVDLDSLSKNELLAEAKKRGIKANASLKKEVILERLKSA